MDGVGQVPILLSVISVCEPLFLVHAEERNQTYGAVMSITLHDGYEVP